MRVPVPDALERIAERVGRALERKGLLVRDCENSFLATDPEAGGPMNDLIGHSITYRVAMGPRAGQKVFTLQTVPAQPQEESRKGVAQYASFSLHAGIGMEAHARTKIEQLARYVSRPAVSVERLTPTAQGDVRYRLKTPYRDGTTHILLEPLDFLARLAALVPPQRALRRSSRSSEIRSVSLARLTLPQAAGRYRCVLRPERARICTLRANKPMRGASSGRSVHRGVRPISVSPESLASGHPRHNTV